MENKEIEEEPSDEIESEAVTENLKETETEEDEAVAENGEEKSDLDLEWEQRKLCSDEGCIGVIGPDGRCKECGKPYET